MIIGFTGTRQPTSSKQNIWLLDQMLEQDIEEFHHGCCINADAQAHRTAKSCIGLTMGQIVLHPPDISAFEMEYNDWDYANCVWAPRKPYLVRDDDIVRESDVVLALAKAGTNIHTPHSGTWYTVRKAVEKGIPVKVCYPDGEVVPF